MNGDGLLGRAELEHAFTELGDRLVRRGVVADLFIVGGAAMALAYDAKRVTRDVDATFVPHGVVLEESRNVAQALGLPPWWLNEQASSYISAQHDAGRREVFDHPGLRVMAASPEHVFAMKAFAARTRDEDDLRTLSEIIGLTTMDEALRLCERFFPGEALPPRSHAMVEDLFAQRDVG
jgi:predicted nucleotidyltransferase